MPQRYRECPSCRALLSQDQLMTRGGLCPYCDARVGEPDEYANPDAAPDGFRRRRPLAPLSVPATIGGKLATALFLFFEQFPLIAGLVLMVKLPANLGIGLLLQQNANPVDPGEVVPLRLLIELFFGPIYLAGIVVVLANRMSGLSTPFADAVRAGLHNWARLFAARAVAGVLIFLGYACLILPGVFLSLRYSFLVEVVVLEGASVEDSRARSSALAAGRELNILAAWLASLILSVAFLSLALGIAREAGALDDPLIQAVVLSLADVFGAFMTIVVFAFYWEARADRADDGSMKPAFEEIQDGDL